MSCSSLAGGGCCPPAQIFQEQICSSTATVTATGTATPAITLSATQGYTDSQSVNNPTTFTITAAAGDSGTYCIILYKRVLS